jgi:LacI family transcriptional regulator
MHVTIRDLARQLNISITTVSRALDGYSDVAEETRRRVVETARQMGYEPSHAARNLRRRQADALGFILPSNEPRFSDPYYASFLTGLCDEAAHQGFDMVLSSAPPDSPQEEALYHHWVQTRRVDGVVLNRLRLFDWRADYLIANQVPFAVLGPGRLQNGVVGVVVDERGAVAQLVERLAARGHRRIAFIGGPEYLAQHAERLGGYRQGLAAAGLPFDPLLAVPGDLSEERGFQATMGLLALPEPPSAILGCNDLTALGALRAERQCGLTPGVQLAVAGFDGLKETEYTQPPLTTIAQPTYETARQLLAMLADLVRGQPPQPAVRCIQPEILWRASTTG